MVVSGSGPRGCGSVPGGGLGDMSISLGRPNGGMAEEGLNDPDVVTLKPALYLMAFI